MRDWNPLFITEGAKKADCNYFKALWGIETMFWSGMEKKPKDCNYFKALWGIETIMPLNATNRGYIAIISKPYEGLKHQLYKEPIQELLLQLFQSLMRDWNDDTLIIDKAEWNCNYFKALWGIETIYRRPEF